MINQPIVHSWDEKKSGTQTNSTNESDGLKRGMPWYSNALHKKLDFNHQPNSVLTTFRFQSQIIGKCNLQMPFLKLFEWVGSVSVEIIT